MQDGTQAGIQGYHLDAVFSMRSYYVDQGNRLVRQMTTCGAEAVRSPLAAEALSVKIGGRPVSTALAGPTRGDVA
jgi:hypothetical protein